MFSLSQYNNTVVLIVFAIIVCVREKPIHKKVDPTENSHFAEESILALGLGNF